MVVECTSMRVSDAFVTFSGHVSGALRRDYHAYRPPVWTFRGGSRSATAYGFEGPLRDDEFCVIDVSCGSIPYVQAVRKQSVG